MSTAGGAAENGTIIEINEGEEANSEEDDEVGAGGAAAVVTKTATVGTNEAQ